METKTYLAFRLNTIRYAIPALSIREIIQKKEVTPVPGSSEFVMGIINLRGKIIPVVDLKQKLDKIEAPPVTNSAQSTEYLKGIGKKDGQVFILIDLLSIWSQQEIQQGVSIENEEEGQNSEAA